MWDCSPENPFAETSCIGRHHCNGEKEEEEEEKAVKWAALLRLPTYIQARTSLFKSISRDVSRVDVTKLGRDDTTLVVDRLVNAFNNDPQLFFDGFKQRFNAVGLQFPEVEIRFEHLEVNAFVHVGTRALPTVPNFVFNMSEAFLRRFHIFQGKRMDVSILKDVSGVVRPSRLTLLLGPPSSGKTTLLLALAGRLGLGLKTSGRITYNGYELDEFIPQRTSAYVSQRDWHMADMTVRETLDFSGRCQGSGYKSDMILELLRREKNSMMQPDEDLDILIKVLALGEQKTSLYAEFIMKILGLDVCADTLVGDEMLKGISGGQKKRLTTGEMLVGASRVLLMDEISTGLDSSTTHQILSYLKHSTRAFETTTVISLLQPDPETFELFDDVILLSEGHIVYQGPIQSSIEFFKHMGFICPERKNVADFLQEVTSMKDQRQYWDGGDSHYQYVTVAKFAEAFTSFRLGSELFRELATPANRRYIHPAALSTSTYGVKRIELLKIGFSWQTLLMKRNSFLFIFKYIQLLLVTLIISSVFFRKTMHHKTLEDGGVYLGAIYFSIVMTLFNGFMEVPMLIQKLPVLYKHRDLRFYPCWVYTVPSWILSIPSSFLESLIWVGITYYMVGFDPDITRCLKQFFIYFLLHQMSISLFRVMASLGRNLIVANTFGSFAMLVVMALGGFIFSRDSIPKWWIWGYWVSPLMYAQNAASVNEFLGHSWSKKVDNSASLSLGEMLLKTKSLFPDSYWYWIGAGALLGYTILFNILFTLFLTYLNPFGTHQAVICKDKHSYKNEKEAQGNSLIELGEFLDQSFSFNGNEREKRGMVLPFQPLSMAFDNVNYYVDVPTELKQHGVMMEKLHLLVNVTGAFRPGILTALVGVSGAGKTTLMDVLSGRKTGGSIKGNIYISGYPKKQETFARISGYCEQDDNHSPCLTVHESLIFSAWMRLPSHVDLKTQRNFVDEVMELVELTPLKEALVGMPGVDGLSTEQRKRLTIAVELVANPSIVFMDEPTSGLDARAAAIVMRTVRNIVNTGRTIVCTIHQPSVDIFESFDELMLMKRGGKLIYAGPLGIRSREIIKYFEAVRDVPKIKPGYNPAAWILDVSSPTEESRLEVDFTEVYQNSALFWLNKQMVERLSKPELDSLDISFPTKYSRSFLSQFIACLWKQNLSYWRNPQYTAVRFLYTVIISLMFGTMCWKFGSKRSTQQDISNAMGSMYSAVLFIGITNATAVQPVVSIERFVSYRERVARMYSALAFAFAQVVIELPYVLIQSLIYSGIFYYMASFEGNLVKFAWYLYFMFSTLLYFTFFGMMTIAVTANHNAAAIVAAPFYMMWNLFSGFMITQTRIPVWWRWYYWANPMAWSLYGLLTSQYGDLDYPVKLADGTPSVPLSLLLKDQFGYRHDFLVVAVVAVAAFCLIFTVTFGFAIKSLNFQRR